MTRAKPLDAFPLVRTQDFDELRVALGHIFAEPTLKPLDDDRTLQAVQNHCRLRHIGVNYGSYGVGIQFQFANPDMISQIFPLGGKADIVIDGTSVTIDRESSAVTSTGITSFDMTSSADYERLNLLIDGNALTGKLAALLGNPVGTPLKFDVGQNFSQPSAQILRDHFLFLVNRLNARTPFPPPVLDEFEQTLMVTFLLANRHNYSDLLEEAPPGLAPQQVRRAEEFIEANWDKPLTLEALAAATQVSVRSLIRDFRRSRGCTPMEFLKQVRLRQARAMLRRPDTDATIEDIAIVCGFADVGRFARDYVRAFGESPLQTLSRGGGGSFNLN